jgi:rubrerythrin
VRPDLEDLRILRLAALYEDAYEKFVNDIASDLPADETVRRRVRQLVSPADRHGERIKEETDRVLARLSPEDRAGVARGALLDVVEIERAAREFYFRHIDELHDPRVVALFRALAHEEDAHVRLAEDAIAAHDATARAQDEDVARDSHIRALLDEEPLPLREGVSDYGTAEPYTPTRKAP